jgi:hypothetical protein
VSSLHSSSTLKLPTQNQLARFRLDKIGDNTVQTFLESGYSLAICGRDCLRLSEWTPPDLQQRFGDRAGLRIAAIAQRLACTGEGGCKSHDIAVFPHLYDRPWRWPPEEIAP